MEAHVHGFGALLFDSVVEDAFAGGVVSSNWSGWLFVAKFDEGLADGATCLGVVEAASDFGFGGTGHDISEDVNIGMNGSVDGWIVGVVTEKVVASAARAGFGDAKVGGVSMQVVDHVTGVTANDCIGVCGCIVEQFDGSLGSGFCAVGLGRAKFVESD